MSDEKVEAPVQRTRGRKRKNAAPAPKKPKKRANGCDSLGGRVVISVCEALRLRGGNHVIAFDNFFSSPDLLDWMLKRQIYAVATIRPNRIGLPKEMCAKMVRGQVDYRQSSGGLFVVKWFDSKPVNFISNYHGFERCAVQRTDKSGNKIGVPALTLVRDYNEHMGGVDHADMLRSLYELDRKADKFWHRYDVLTF